MRALLAGRTSVALGCALFLSACKTFSPDGGMDVVASIAGSELRKDVLAVRTPEDAARADEQVARL